MAVLWLFDTVEKFVISNVEGEGPWYSKSISVSLLLMKLKKSVAAPEAAVRRGRGRGCARHPYVAPITE